MAIYGYFIHLDSVPCGSIESNTIRIGRNRAVHIKPPGASTQVVPICESAALFRQHTYVDGRRDNINLFSEKSTEKKKKDEPRTPSALGELKKRRKKLKLQGIECGGVVLQGRV